MLNNDLNRHEITVLKNIVNKYKDTYQISRIEEEMYTVIWDLIPNDKKLKLEDGRECSLIDALHNANKCKDPDFLDKQIAAAWFEVFRLKNNQPSQNSIFEEKRNTGDAPGINAEKNIPENEFVNIVHNQPANQMAGGQSGVSNPKEDTAIEESQYKAENINAQKIIKKDERSIKSTVRSDYRFTLKNGRVGQEYSDELDFSNIPVEGKVVDFQINIKELEIIGGLEFDKEKRLLKGIPKNAGKPHENYEFKLNVNFETDKAIKQKREFSIKIFPDPRSLWKSLEPEPKEDWKNHTDKDIIKFKEKESLIKTRERILVAASKRGRSHAHNAKFRDDHMRIARDEKTDWSMMAVADGMGSAELSRVGSKIACDTSIEYISNKLLGKNNLLSQSIKKTHEKKDDTELKNILYQILAGAAFEAHKAIEEEAKKRETKKIQDFHTTILLLIYKKYSFGYFIAGFWIGDGALAIYDKKNGVILLGKPDAGKFSGETKPVTDKQLMTPEELLKRVKYKIVDDFTAAFAMSDGVSDAKFLTEKNLEEKSFWDKFWEELNSEVFTKGKDLDQYLLDWLDFWVEGEHDDRTIAILF